MNLPPAPTLVLVYTLVAWVCVWNIIVNRRAENDEHALYTHIVGVIGGAGAALGAFLIGASILVSHNDAQFSMSMNIMGRVILLIYVCALYGYRKQSITTALTESLDSMLRHEATPGTRRLHVQRQRNIETSAHSSLEQRLGMPTERFFNARIGDHALLWAVMLALTLWGYTLHEMTHIRDIDTTTFILSAALSLVAIGILLVIVLCIPPLMYLTCIVVMPFAFLSVHVETALRICLNRPYTPS